MRDFEAALRSHWWAVTASVARATGDLDRAEDAAQEACLAALTQWPADGVPQHPGRWLIAVAHRKAIDGLRRESVRRDKEHAAALGWEASGPVPHPGALRDDQLALILACCHPGLDPTTQITLTLRVICGLPTSTIAALLLVPPATIKQRLLRGKGKIRAAGIPLRLPEQHEIGARIGATLRVIYLIFTEGHYPRGSEAPVDNDLCEEAIRLSRALAVVVPDDPEVTGLLALLLLTDARRPARVSGDGDPVLLADQDRSLWNRARIDEGLQLLEQAARHRRPGMYQLQAAIAACHAEARVAAETHWRQIALLYNELLAFEPSAVIEANRAVAVAMSEGPMAGLTILDALAGNAALARWPQLHTARGTLLADAGRPVEAVAAYRTALALEPPAAERRFLAARIAALSRS